MDIQRNDYVERLYTKSWETFSLRNTRDSFRKIVILDGYTLPWTDDEGVTFMGVIPFLLGIDKALI